MPLKIILPWPAKCLNPNNTPHWSKLAKARGKAKYEAMLAAIDAMNRQGWRGCDEATTKITFFHKPDSVKRPSYKHRDRDNHLAMLKATFDGFAAAQVITNDSGFRHPEVEFVPDKTRRVEIEITAKEESPCVVKS
jgi:Holliday junction resolvase RusA-like endonuclease